ncbi:hypothetical protein PIB30_099928 [Stylosanthes scabra]|uniref:Protein unc-45 homolog B n=1 Tax=Stylosanthes scabra TaxID=79078 RepID=A0ABU6RXD8_9FABA|nr:hypothetical protein [Stylosanthes scabra]
MESKIPEISTCNNNHLLPATPTYTNCFCFFCIISETEPNLRKSGIYHYFKQMPLKDDQEHVLVLSALWKIAMTKPNDPEFPSLGIFRCMAKLIQKGVSDKAWLLRHQNIYIPYYAAHIIGSYAMNKPKFTQKALNSKVLQPLLELLQGKISWVERRVAIRALGHLTSHEATFEAITEHEVEIIEAAINIASSCIDEVYREFLGLKEFERLDYHKNLITRGIGGLELENRKAEEWASELQCWSLYLVDRFVRRRKRCLRLICKKKQFLKDLCGMWGGLMSPSSPAGVGVLRTLCRTRIGRETIADLHQVVDCICNVSRSSDYRQYMAIESLVELVRDPVTRYRVIDAAAPVLADLVELKSIRGRLKHRVGQEIMQALLHDYHKIKFCRSSFGSERTKKILEELWNSKVDRVRKEKLMNEEEIREKEELSNVLKNEANKKFRLGEIENSLMNYSKALGLCPLKLAKERIVLYSNRAQCYLLLENAEAAISDTTRALCLSSTVNCTHSKSLWRRSQAYDMKGLAKESLMDCLMFVSNRFGLRRCRRKKGFKIIPYYAARMINKQMNSTWIFAPAKSKTHG